jgi:hypothetical protein
MTGYSLILDKQLFVLVQKSPIYPPNLLHFEFLFVEWLSEAIAAVITHPFSFSYLLFSFEINRYSALIEGALIRLVPSLFFRNFD